jgi:hypothetical protein
MANIPGTIPLGGPIAPTALIDVYATHFAQFQFGGWRAVNNEAERDAIPLERREEGMVVYIKQPVSIEYELVGGITNTHWQIKVGSGSTNLHPSNEKFVVNSTIIANGFVTLLHTPNILNEHIFVIINGLVMDEGVGEDYTLTNNILTIHYPIEIDDKIIVKYKY